MSAREMLRQGRFNSMSQSPRADGATDIILTRRGDPNRYHLAVERLYQPTERVLIDEVLPPGQQGG